MTAHSDHDAISDEAVRQAWDVTPPAWGGKEILAEWRAGELTTVECETELAKLGYGEGDPIAVALGAVQMSHPELAAEILRERISGKSLRQIGAEYGISAVRVKQIVVRESIRAMCTCRVPGSNPDCVLHGRLNESKAQPLAPDDTDLKGKEAHR